LRYFFSRRIPAFRRVLLVESGSRSLLENLLPGIYETHGPNIHLDVVTCYAGKPEGFDEGRGAVYHVADYQGADGRGRLYRVLDASRYDITGIICSGEPVMTKWKWMLALRSPGKLFILNENGDYFWFDYSQWAAIKHFVLFRAGLSGAGAVDTLLRLLLFPLTFLYLLAYAAVVHTRRRFRAS
jgi:hypothetical protein